MICTVPAMLVASYLITHSYIAERANAERNTLATTRALMQAVDGELISAQSSLRVLATSPYLHSPVILPPFMSFRANCCRG